MILDFSLPQIMPQMTEAGVHSWLSTEGQKLEVGVALMELVVDLSALFVHDCPPISYYRVAVREPVWLRQVQAGKGASVAVGQVVARFSTTPDEPIDGPATRPLRVMIAGVIPNWQDEQW